MKFFTSAITLMVSFILSAIGAIDFIIRFVVTKQYLETSNIIYLIQVLLLGLSLFNTYKGYKKHNKVDMYCGIIKIFTVMLVTDVLAFCATPTVQPLLIFKFVTMILCLETTTRMNNIHNPAKAIALSHKIIFVIYSAIMIMSVINKVEFSYCLGANLALAKICAFLGILVIETKLVSYKKKRAEHEELDDFDEETKANLKKEFFN